MLSRCFVGVLNGGSVMKIVVVRVGCSLWWWMRVSVFVMVVLVDRMIGFGVIRLFVVFGLYCSSIWMFFVFFGFMSLRSCFRWFGLS